AQGEGPYRLGGFSGTSIVLFALAKLFEANGDQVVQLLIVDHFPLLFTSALYVPDDESIKQRSPSTHSIRHTLKSAVALYRASNQQHQRIADHLDDAIEGRPTLPYMERWYKTFFDILFMAYDFLFDLVPICEPFTMAAARRVLIEWMKDLKAPVTASFASGGILSLEAAGPLRIDGGVHEVFPSATIVEVEATHFSIFESATLVDLI
ncbi:hypothetical protein BJ138DRAFT_976179, partial [Hygrophoropsis aurantiaca]